MKNIDRIELGKRLWRYFRKSGCDVEVYTAEGKYGERECHVDVRRITRWTGGDFQRLDRLIGWRSSNANDSFDKVALQFADWYCGARRCGWGGKYSGWRADEFLSASSAEELDLKLAARGF